MIDLATIIQPQKLAWEHGANASVAQLFPGPANTTLDRSAIGENEAQDILNVTVVNGVWQLDQRYRQFAPTPTSTSDTVLVSHTLPCYLLLSHTGTGVPQQCSAAAVSGYCSLGWGYNSGGLLNCVNGSPIINPPH